MSSINKACEVCKGACCESMTLQLSEADNVDEKRWLVLHGKLYNDWVELPCPCSMLVDGKCSIYETRPDKCDKAQVGGFDCIFAISRRRPENVIELMNLIGIQIVPKPIMS